MPSVSVENTPDVVFGSSVAPFLAKQPKEVSGLVCVAMMKIIAVVRQSHSDDPDLLRALTKMEILVQRQFTPNRLPKPVQSAYDTPDP